MAVVKQEDCCTAPSQHVHGAAEFVRHVERVCRERGLRMTPLRADVVRILATSQRPLKAYDVLDQIRASKARSAPATAYRTLNFLLQQGFIHRLESLNAFVVCHHPGQAQHVAPFLICNRCQQATNWRTSGQSRRSSNWLACWDLRRRTRPWKYEVCARSAAKELTLNGFDGRSSITPVKHRCCPRRVTTQRHMSQKHFRHITPL